MKANNHPSTMRRLAVSLLVLCASLAAFAQKVSVRGTVTDSRNEPIIGASVLEQGTSNGVATDLDGRFTIQVDRNATLRISYIGCKTRNVKAADNMKVVLEDEANMLDEVVTIGYGSVKRKDVTTAVSSVSTADLDTRPIVSAVQGMQGKAAGLQISQANGQPGAAPTIRVRGTTSLNGSNNPLYVVDGVPVDNIDYLSADDIDNIQILKDASGAAIYGSRAANGVVIIGTKQGKAGVAKVSLNAHYAFNTVRDNQNPLNARQYRDLIDDMNEKGVIVHSNFKRYNVRGTIENDINKWLTINASVAYSDYTYKGTGIISGTGSDRGGVVPAILTTPSFGPVWDEEHPGQYYSDFYGVNVDGPLENIARTKDNKSQYNKLLASGKATVRLMPRLTWTSTLSFDRSSATITNFLDPWLTREGRNQHGTGYDSRSTGTVWTFDNVVNWKRNLGRHGLDAMAGSSWTHSDWSQNYINGSDYANDDIRTLNAANKISWTGTGSSASDWAILSFFGRLQYNWNDTYMLTANLRADGSSRLAPGHRWGCFPSFSGAWRVSSEKFMKNVAWIDDLKIRGGWGQTGNQSGLGDYGYLAMYGFGRVEWWKPGQEHATATRTQSSLSNPELTWETTSQTNLGFDLTVLRNRLTFYFDVYYKKTSDLLISVTLPAGSAPARNLTYNGGEIVNKGLELAVSSKNLTGKLKWNTDFNISFNRNKVEKLDLVSVYWNATTGGKVGQSVVRNAVGHPLGAFYGYVSEGVDPETGDLLYKDVNENGLVSAGDRTYIGDPNPDFTFGLTNTFSYKGFDLSVLLQGSVGNDIYNVSRMDSEGMFDGRNQSTRVLERWRVPGQKTDVPRVGFNQQNSTYYLEDGSYLRVKDITLAYNVPRNMLKKMGLTRLMPYISLSNLLTFTNYSGRDPEVNQHGDSGAVQGIDWGTYPLNRSFVVGLKVEF